MACECRLTVLVGLVLGGRDVAEGLVQALVVPPVDTLPNGEASSRSSRPRQGPPRRTSSVLNSPFTVSVSASTREEGRRGAARGSPAPAPRPARSALGTPGRCPSSTSALVRPGAQRARVDAELLRDVRHALRGCPVSCRCARTMRTAHPGNRRGTCVVRPWPFPLQGSKPPPDPGASTDTAVPGRSG